MNKEEEEYKNAKDEKQNEDAAKRESRIVISHEADTAVSEMTEAVNDGFEAGRATRFDIASFMIIWCKNQSSEDVIFEIRRHLADSFSMLEAIQKKAKNSGDLPTELKLALEKYFFGNGTQNQKKGKKHLKLEYITDTHEKGEAS